MTLSDKLDQKSGSPEIVQKLWPPPAPDAPTHRSRRFLKGAAFFLLMLLLGMLAGKYMPQFFSEAAGGQPWLILIGFVLALWPNVVLHEAGHAVFGMLTGMRPIIVGIGRFRFERGVTGWYFRKAGAVAGISGFVCLVPREERAFSRLNQALYLIGGPLINLLTAAIGMALLAPGGGNTGFSALAFGGVLSALTLGVANLLPFQTHGWRSDGLGLLDIIRNRPEALIQHQVTQLTMLSMSDIRPRDWPASLVPTLPADPSVSILTLNVALLRLVWAGDRNDVAEADALAAFVVPHLHEVPVIAQPHLAVCIAGYIARMHPHPDLLEAWLPLCEGGMTDLSAFRSWLHAEHAALTGQATLAQAKIDEARINAGRLFDPASVRLLHEYLDQLESHLLTTRPLQVA